MKIGFFVKKDGITLIALVITIVILIILVGIAINTMLGNDGLLNRTKTATEEYNKQTATESINLKITTCQMNTYAETQRMPTLKELAVELEKDNEIQYVNGSQRVASTQDINFTTATSIFTKLKSYPYEFEINSSLQLASIDGMQVASVPVNDDYTIVSMTKKELRKMIQDEISITLSTINSNSNIQLLKRDYLPASAIDSCTPTTLESIPLNSYGNGKAIISFSVQGSGMHTDYCSAWIYKDAEFLGCDTDSVGADTRQKDAACSLSATIDYNEETVISLGMYSSATLTPYYSYSILIIPNRETNNN